MKWNGMKRKEKTKQNSCFIYKNLQAHKKQQQQQTQQNSASDLVEWRMRTVNNVLYMMHAWKMILLLLWSFASTNLPLSPPFVPIVNGVYCQLFTYLNEYGTEISILLLFSTFGAFMCVRLFTVEIFHLSNLNTFALNLCTMLWVLRCMYEKTYFTTKINKMIQINSIFLNFYYLYIRYEYVYVNMFEHKMKYAQSMFNIGK